MPVRARRSIAILLFNAALAAVIQLAAPTQPKLTDRHEYDYNGRSPLQPFCPNTIYCYRVLVPVVLEAIPADPELRWRSYQWLMHTLTGSAVAAVSAGFASPFMASAVLQTGYAFTFTAYDPYTPDPLVFLIAALVLHCWMIDRSLAVSLIAVVGVFAKETVGPIVAAPAIAVLLAPERSLRVRWIIPVILAGAVLFGFHWYMDTYAGWGISRNPAASFAAGSWLAIWWNNNPSIMHKAMMVFSPFGFAWLFAALGFLSAPAALRQLALGAIVPMLMLVFVQTPERALGNSFFVVVPLAAAFLARASTMSAWAAVITNGLLTARNGLSTEWLPGTAVLVGPAVLASAWAITSVLSTRDKIQN